MNTINYMGEIHDAKKNLAHAIGNLSEIIKILENLTESESVDLLFYDKNKSHFYDKINHNTISVSYLEEGTTSIIGKAYVEKVPYRSSHLRFDSNYNISLDNPYKLNISSQIIFPILRENIVIGMIRFCKFKYTYEKALIKLLAQLEGAFLDIFFAEADDETEKNYESIFSAKEYEVQASLRTLHTELKKLTTYTHNPEIKKLIEFAEGNVNAIHEYMAFKPNSIEQKNALEECRISKNGLRVLIVDDVHMNVKILYAMIKKEKNLDIYFAYDGIEAMQKIEKAHKDKKPIDVLFLDHYMPGMLGLEVTKNIRKIEEENNINHKMKIVSITNDPSAIEREKKLYDYNIPKPFVKSDLIEVMHHIKETR